jgi:hypothetical protein
MVAGKHVVVGFFKEIFYTIDDAPRIDFKSRYKPEIFCNNEGLR